MEVQQRAVADPSPLPRRTALVLSAVFFVSGASALVFETLWFRLAGLAFGNGVWASALVLSSFMAGLALGNGLAVRRGARIRRPARAYALVELVVAAAGISLVLFLPASARLFAPLFRALGEHPLLQNALRLSLSFLLLLVPATAMGTTLPLLVKALHGPRGGFGPALGRLYGWNTLGAVAGALLGETVLVERFGVRGAGLCAGALNVLAALGALALGRGLEVRSEERAEAPRPLGPRAVRLLLASGLSGGLLLALEVVWFRFLQLFVPGTSLTFAVLLSIVLAGIGLGGLLASLWLARAREAQRLAPVIALGAGTAAALLYGLLDVALGARTEVHVAGYGLEGVHLGVLLMFPVALLSGVLFALQGQALHAELGEETRAAGLLTMANTLGGTLGPLLAGFVCIPRLGMERSFFLCALLYAAVALLLLERGPRSRGRRALELGSALALGATLLLFPFGRMQRFLGIASAAYRKDGATIVATREGLTETIQYLREDFLGRPVAHRLVTNGFSMASTHEPSRRYMKYYVYWPVALHPGPRSALLVSYGCGSTARALADTRALDSIVVVDVSRDVLELADVVYPEPGENPLEDPRTEVHVEDGRFFLQTTERRFDLITSEPPPPKLAGIVNLYSREYFALLRERLAPGGMVTYWLPVSQLAEDETCAIARAFLEVFGDETSLWNGCGLNWMLVGTRDAQGPVSAQHFAAQWADPRVAPELRALGFEEPGQIGATFLMDAADLRGWTAESAPLTDDRPKRLSSRLAADPESLARYAAIMDARAAAERFERSAYVRRLWPASVRQASLDFFPAQEVLNRITAYSLSAGQVDFALLHHVLTSTSLRVPILWGCGSSSGAQAILRETDPEALPAEPAAVHHLAVGALAERDCARAERLLALEEGPDADARNAFTRLYLLCLDRRFDEARRLVADRPRAFEGPAAASFLRWLARTTGFGA